MRQHPRSGGALTLLRRAGDQFIRGPAQALGVANPVKRGKFQALSSRLVRNILTYDTFTILESANRALRIPLVLGSSMQQERKEPPDQRTRRAQLPGHRN